MSRVPAKRGVNSDPRYSTSSRRGTLPEFQLIRPRHSQSRRPSTATVCASHEDWFSVMYDVPDMRARSPEHEVVRSPRKEI